MACAGYLIHCAILIRLLVQAGLKQGHAWSVQLGHCMVCAGPVRGGQKHEKSYPAHLFNYVAQNVVILILIACTSDDFSDRAAVTKVCTHAGETHLGMHGILSQQLRSMQTLSSVLPASVMPESPPCGGRTEHAHEEG